MMEKEAAVAREPTSPSESWLILQRLEDLSAQIKEIRQEFKEVRHEIKEVRQELKQDIETLRAETRRLDNEVAAIRRDNRATWLGAFAIWATIMGALLGLYLR